MSGLKEKVAKRLWWRVDQCKMDEQAFEYDEMMAGNHCQRVSDIRDANLISSLTNWGTHMPAIDIDLPVHVLPSSTEGHFHLYIEHELTWKQYKELLAVMVKCGIVEEGYFKAALSSRMTLLRKPGVRKPEPVAA